MPEEMKRHGFNKNWDYNKNRCVLRKKPREQHRVEPKMQTESHLPVLV
jgi:hypothetical protein